MRDKPAVDYPASDVDSDVVRADMESASPKRQSLRAAGKLPEELSAFIGVGKTLFAMMGDQCLAASVAIFFNRVITPPA